MIRWGDDDVNVQHQPVGRSDYSCYIIIITTTATTKLCAQVPPFIIVYEESSDIIRIKLSGVTNHTWLFTSYIKMKWHHAFA